MTDIFRSRLDRSRRLGRRAGVLTAVGIGAVLMLAPTASAADNAALAGGDTPSAADRSAAQQTLVSPETTSRLATFFVHLDQRTAGGPGAVAQSQVAPEAAAAQAPQLVGAAVPVYSLNADFVRGKSSVPVANFAYLATEARSAAGVEATVWTVRDRQSHNWRIANVLSGADEVTFARQAAGDLVFTEPQIAAWYHVHAGRVLPLNPAARDSVGAKGVSVAAYQKLVHGRYGDKLAGSTYQQSGKLGGFSSTQGTAAASHDNGYSATDIALPAGAAGVVVLGAGTFLVRRRRTSTT
ncbi:hypothetical protein [Embleya sp. AB8]|uniref:hypothetical protein n=1 Tax=Embleya sp. AB8 TaxID=3156304 RepID=UPI003C75900D